MDGRTTSPLSTAVLIFALPVLAYALTAVAQERVALTNSGPMGCLNPRFLLAVVLNAGGAGMHVLALRQAALTTGRGRPDRGGGQSRPASPPLEARRWPVRAPRRS